VRFFVSLICIAVFIACQGTPPPPPPEVRIIGEVFHDPDRSHDRDFTPTGDLVQLSPHLFLYRDSCNVYIITQDDNAVLINFGTGDVLNVLSSLGISSIDQVLVTHHHRNLVQGLCDLPDYDFKVIVPEKETPFFESVESFWSDVRVFLNYNLRSHFNTIRKSIRVDGRVEDGDLLQWQGIEFKVIETPGATDHAVSYVTKVDEQTIVFTGDLIAGEGKVHNWYDLHWNYYGFTQGINASDLSFERIREEKPKLLLPSHGEPIHNPDLAMAENGRIYANLREMLLPNELHRTMGQMRQILPHLVHLGGPDGSPLGGMTTYAILSESGRALLYDYGYADLEQVELFKKQFNIENIDVATFSHYHDDHMIRVHDLLRDNDTKIWVFENMVDILRNPERYRLPCLLPFPIRADRVLKDGEKVRWEEYTLEFFHMPGQTEFHQGLFTVIDGKKILFTGDNTWKKEDRERTRNGPVVPQNEYLIDGGFITCAKKMLQYMPDIVCPSHTEEYSPSRADLEEFLDWAYRVRDTMTHLVDQPDPNFGVDYRWCHFYPYQSYPEGSDEFEIELVIRNHLFKQANVEVELKLPPELDCSVPNRSFKIAPKTQVAVPFRLRRLRDSEERQVVTADLTINNHRFGERAEALVH